MSGSDSPSNFPIGFSIKLISFDEDRSSWFRSSQNAKIRGHSLLGMYLNDISGLDILRSYCVKLTISYQSILS